MNSKIVIGDQFVSLLPQIGLLAAEDNGRDIEVETLPGAIGTVIGCDGNGASLRIVAERQQVNLYVPFCEIADPTQFEEAKHHALSR